MAKLQRMGFDISVCEVFSPAPAAVAVLKDRGMRPHLLVYDGITSFDSLPIMISAFEQAYIIRLLLIIDQ